MHSTKLPLWKWLLAIYYMINSNKGVSSVVLGKWVVVSQKTAWKMGHGIRAMMAAGTQGQPLLNGIVNYDFWLPAPTMRFPGVTELIARYQARASAEGVDPLGYYMAPWGYSQLQVLGEAVEATKSLDEAKLGEYMRTATFKTVVGDITFGPNGELSKPFVVMIQFHDLKSGDVQPFRDLSAQTIVWPKEYKTGEVIYPYANAKK